VAKAKTIKKFGAALSDAMKVLEKYDTPEVATKLVGEERAKYLKALDEVYGPSRGADRVRAFHGTEYVDKPIDQFRLGKQKSGQLYGEGTYVTKDPEEASVYAQKLDQQTGQPLADESGAVYDLSVDPGKSWDIVAGDFDPQVVEKIKPMLSKADQKQLSLIEDNYNLAEFLKGKIEPRDFSKTLNSLGYNSVKVDKDVYNIFSNKRLRSSSAAFDPRFKDSPLLMAGVGAGVGNKYEINRNDPNAPLREGGKALLGAAKKANDWYQENIVGPAAAVLKSQMTPTINVRGQEFETGNALTDMGQEILVDPTSYIEGPISAGITAAQIAAEMAPQKKSKGGMVYKPKAEYIEKLYKGGKITKETAARCGYAEGGLVTPTPGSPEAVAMLRAQQVPTPSDRIPLSEVPGAIAQSIGSGIKSAGTGLANLIFPEAQGVSKSAPMVAQAAEAPQYQLASAQTGQPMPEGAVELEQFGQAQAPMAGMAQMPMGGGADAAINQAVNAGMVEGVQTGAAIKTMQDTLRTAADEEKQKAQLAQEDFKAKQLEIDDLVSQYQKAAPNPQAAREQFWADKTTGQKILGGIGLVLGAMSRDGINRSVGMIEKAIDQNIEAQTKKQQSLGSLIGEKRGMLSDLRKMYGDERDARMAFKDQALKIAQLEIDKVAAQTKSAGVRANLAIAKEELIGRRMEIQSKLLENGRMQNMVAGSAGSVTAQVMTKVPKELRAEALKEVATLRQIEAAKKEIPRVFNKMKELQKSGSRLGSPIQSKKLLAANEAQLFPIVKQIVGERMTDADARIMITPYLTSFFEGDQTADQKAALLIEQLEAQASGRTPLLSDFGIVSPQRTLKLKERAR
jgi:hypothetical protein